jgi:hypothetical protein
LPGQKIQITKKHYQDSNPQPITYIVTTSVRLTTQLPSHITRRNPFQYNRVRTQTRTKMEIVWLSSGGRGGPACFVFNGMQGHLMFAFSRAANNKVAPWEKRHTPGSKEAYLHLFIEYSLCFSHATFSNKGRKYWTIAG